jgi:hypothetical protein
MATNAYQFAGYQAFKTAWQATALIFFLAHTGHSETLSEDYAFSPFYLGGSYSKLNPASVSQKRYTFGEGSAQIQYHFFMRDTWAMSLTAGFKSFQRFDDIEDAYFVGTIDSQKIFRLYHPLWLGAGFKSMYIVGVERAQLPYTKSQDRSVDIGAGFIGTLFYVANSSLIVHSSVSRWRGTADNQLHAIEFNLGASFKFL